MGMITRKAITGRQANGAAVKGAEEHVVAEVKGVDTTPTEATVLLIGTLDLATVAEATDQTLTIRRNSITGEEVASYEIDIAGAGQTTMQIAVEDKPGEVANMTYVLTFKETAAKEDIPGPASLTAVF